MRHVPHEKGSLLANNSTGCVSTETNTQKHISRKCDSTPILHCTRSKDTIEKGGHHMNPVDLLPSTALWTLRVRKEAVALLTSNDPASGERPHQTTIKTKLLFDTITYTEVKQG